MNKKIEMIYYEKIPEYTGLESDSAFITIKDECEWFGDRYATCVGRIDKDGNITSRFKKDTENNNTEIFNKLRQDITLLEKHRTVCDFSTGNINEVVDYFIPYRVKNHSSLMSTVVDSYVNNCSNVSYNVEYEILFVFEEGYTRYVTMSYQTEGTYASSFFDQIENIEDVLEEWFEDNLNGFKIDKEEGMQVAFYDETGDELYITIDSMRELLSMISSIRVIKCEHTIIK